MPSIFSNFTVQMAVQLEEWSLSSVSCHLTKLIF